jgi:hypothetical protein
MNLRLHETCGTHLIQYTCVYVSTSHTYFVITSDTQFMAAISDHVATSVYMYMYIQMIIVLILDFKSIWVYL